MTAHAWLLLVSYSALLVALAWPLAGVIVHVMEGRFAFGRRIEAPLYRAAGVEADAETGWLHYALGLLLFNLLGALAVYGLQRLQHGLPLNPAGFADVAPDSAFNTAVSFATNTDWQGYSGEQTMSHLTQMLGLAVQNFLSAATGLVVAIALIRGFVRRSADTIGNVWVDLTRATLWLLLPACVVLALFFASQGVVQSLAGFLDATTVEGAKQALPLGPVASQEAIKMLGTNGGGFFNANSAHPFENPSALTNLVQMLAIFLIPAALCGVLGRMVGDRRRWCPAS